MNGWYLRVTGWRGQRTYQAAISPCSLLARLLSLKKLYTTPTTVLTTSPTALLIGKPPLTLEAKLFASVLYLSWIETKLNPLYLMYIPLKHVFLP